jgi:hypothetical protein
MLSLLGNAEATVGKDDIRYYKGAHVTRTTGTAIERIIADGKFLDPMIGWPATTHQSIGLNERAICIYYIDY